MEPFSPGIPRVALLIETARGYGRGLLRGIVRYARLHGPWAFYVTPGDLEQRLPQMDEWGGRGIIARIETAQTAEAVLASGLPLIALDLNAQQLAPGSPLAEVSEVCPDSHRAARFAAEHLLERGLRQFAFVGAFDDPLWSTRREEGFTERLAEAGFPCQYYPLPQRKQDRQWAREQAIMSAWIHGLPKPIGLLACDDDRGREVIEACRAAGAQVPEDVAVVGVDNDEFACELSDPPLSSVAFDTERAGYEAAALLDGLMSGRIRQPQRIWVAPRYVVARRSTDVLALEDRAVAAALRFIHDNAGRPIGVRDVVRHCSLSRRALELRFQRVVGRAVHAEMRRVRLERAQRLVAETELSIHRIAEDCGFGSGGHLTRAFVQAFQTTPTRYRAEHRHG